MNLGFMIQGGRWGRVLIAGLIVLSALMASCGPRDSDPVADPVPDYHPPEHSVEDGVRMVWNQGPRELLRVRNDLPPGRARLLFMDGRSAAPTSGGGSVWADMEGGRVIVFDRAGRVSRIVQSGDGSVPAEPVVAWLRDGEVRIFERDGSQAMLREGERRSAQPHLLPVPVTGADSRRVVASRSPLYLPLAPVRPEAPLVWTAEDPAMPSKELGQVTVPDEPMLGYLHNAGWAVPTPDGGAYFASAIRPELVRLNSDGGVEWRSSWAPSQPVREPRIVAVDGTARAEFRILQYAVATGDDGRLYVLAASGLTSQPDQLLVFEPDGTLLRTAAVSPGDAIFADARGVVSVIPEARTLRDPSVADRPRFPSFDLPGLGSEAPVRLEAYEGQVVVVNFWASWCPPCRREIPVLDSLAQELGSRGLAVVGLNDDVLPQHGLAFLNELGGVSYENGAGEGGLRRAYGYRGLPYTVVLDREQRVVQSFYGFGGSLESLRRVVLDELEIPEG